MVRNSTTVLYTYCSTSSHPVADFTSQAFNNDITDLNITETVLGLYTYCIKRLILLDLFYMTNSLIYKTEVSVFNVIWDNRDRRKARFRLLIRFTQTICPKTL